MMLVQHEARYRGRITDYGLHSSEDPASQALAVVLQFETIEAWNPDSGAWEPYAGYTTRGRFFVVDRTGAPIEGAIERFVRATGPFNLARIAAKEWDPPLVSFEVKSDVNPQSGRTYHHAAWLHHWESGPRPAGNVNGDEAMEVARRHVAAVDAVAKNLARKPGVLAENYPVEPPPVEPPAGASPPASAPV